MGNKTKYIKNKKGEFAGSHPTPKKPAPSPNINSFSANVESESSTTVGSNYDTAYAAYIKTNIPKTPHLPTAEQPTEILELVEQINDSLDVIEFPNHSADYSQEWVNLQEVKETPSIAKNNCFAATSAISQHLYEKIGLSQGWTNMEIELYFEHKETKKNSGVHWANVIEYSETKEKWIIDYTGQQFDTNAPFPIVAKYEEWKQWVSSTIKNKYGQELSSETLY